MRGDEVPGWLRDGDAYERRRVARGVLYHVTRPTLGHFLSPAMNLACVGAEALPPFPPRHRSQDVLFQMFLQQNRRGILAALLPATVEHVRLERRESAGALTLEMVNGGSWAAWVGRLLRAYQREDASRDPVSFGIWLGGWIRGEPEEFGRYAEELYWRELSEQGERLRAQVRDRDFCEAYRQELKGVVESLDQQLLKGKPAWPVEWRGDGENVSPRWGELETLVRLLEHWPAVWKAALELKRRGCGAARSLR
ncbi:MAG: hypothetical protein HC904_13255 [Blastochloris sp.]|nr:hypothetical protein [Blastochloris sp.]